MPQGIGKFHDVSKHNKEILLRFEEDNRLDNLSEITVMNYTKFMVKFGIFLKDKPFGNVTKDDVKEFLKNINYSSRSIETMKMALKKFYRWIYNLDKSDRQPDCVRWIKFKTYQQLEREKDIDDSKKKTISYEEYEQMIHSSTGNLQYQAIIETFYWYGCRISELLSMNVGDVEHMDIGVQITIRKSKTKPRKITVPESEHYPQYLMDWVDAHPYKHKSDKSLWISLRSDRRVHHKCLRKDTLDQTIHKISKNAGIGKKITPHMFRHTAITRDCKNGMPWTHVTTKYGLTKNSRMQMVYDHNEHDEYLEWLKSRKDSVTAPSYNEIKKQKERIEKDFEQRLQSMEQKFEEKMKIMDSGLSRATRRNVPGYPSQKIIEDYQRLKKGLEMMLNRMTVEGRSQAEIEEFRKMITSGLA